MKKYFLILVGFLWSFSASATTNTNYISSLQSTTNTIRGMLSPTFFNTNADPITITGAVVAASIPVNGNHFQFNAGSLQLLTGALTTNLNVNHIKGQGGVPTLSLNANAGSGGTGAIGSNDTATASDTAVTIGLLTGAAAQSAGPYFTNFFSTAYSTAPHVIMSPLTSSARNTNFYISEITTTYFVVSASPNTVPISTHYLWNFIVVQ